MQCFLKAICRCDATADIAFATVMAEKGVKVGTTICTLLYADDPLSSCLSHKVIIEELMELTCVSFKLRASVIRRAVSGSS